MRQRHSLSFVVVLFSSLTLYAQDGWFWQVPQPVGNDFRDLYAIDENIVFAVGESGIILHTKDRGDSWIIQKNPRSGWFAQLYSLVSICFKDSLNGWALGAGDFLASYYTQDGGLTWEPFEDFSFGRGMTFIDSQNGWLISGSIYRSTDGGLALILQKYLKQLMAVKLGLSNTSPYTHRAAMTNLVTCFFSTIKLDGL